MKPPLVVLFRFHEQYKLWKQHNPKVLKDYDVRTATRPHHLYGYSGAKYVLLDYPEGISAYEVEHFMHRNEEYKRG